MSAALARLRRWPSAGLVVLVVSVAATLSFFAWGLQRPPLDELWELDIHLELGRRERPTPHELALLHDSLRRHAKVADDFLDGAEAGLITANRDGWVDLPYALLIRQSSEAMSRLRVTPSASKAAGIRICAKVGKDESCGEAEVDEPFTWALPPEGPFPQLVEMRIGGEKKGARWVHVEWEGAP